MPIGNGVRINISDTDYKDVGVEAFTYVLDEFAAFQDKVREFLDEREEAAPNSVLRARLLLGFTEHGKREWQKFIRD